jgi:predicted PurR-regulated permease PerM
LNLAGLIDQLLPNVQNLLSRVGGLLSAFASGAAATLGWTGFILLVAYFLLAESNQVSRSPILMDLPGYNYDIRRMGNELRRIWNAYGRGQILIIGLVILIYSLVFSILGIRYAVGIALMAGLARFVPYVGPLITNLTLALVAFFQGSNYFHLDPIFYALLAVVISIVVDQIVDNMIAPILMGETLGVHPAAVLVAALVAANLLGIIGLVLAAPVFATITLLLRYAVRKLSDQDPWQDSTRPATPPDMPGGKYMRRLAAWMRLQYRKMQNR